MNCVNHYKTYVDDEIFEGFDCLTKTRVIPKFEKKSAEGDEYYPPMSIIIYDYDNRYMIRSLVIIDRYDAEKQTNLLFINKENHSHCVYIRKLNHPLGPQLLRGKWAKYVYRLCLTHFG